MTSVIAEVDLIEAQASTLERSRDNLIDRFRHNPRYSLVVEVGYRQKVELKQEADVQSVLNYMRQSAAALRRDPEKDPLSSAAWEHHRQSGLVAD